jgi:hypothetical protein
MSPGELLARADPKAAALEAELGEIEARIAEASATRSGSPDDLRDARAARTKAEEPARAAGEAPRAGTVRPPVRSPEAVSKAKALYRVLARNCHQDLAADEADRERSLAFMVRLNDAYARFDAGAIALLSREWEEAVSAARVPQTGPERLVSLRAAVRAAQGRLARIRAELAEVTGAGLGVLLFPGGADGADIQAALSRLDALDDAVRASPDDLSESEWARIMDADCVLLFDADTGRTRWIKWRHFHERSSGLAARREYRGLMVSAHQYNRMVTVRAHDGQRGRLA